jgi:hypothetical protein
MKTKAPLHYSERTKIIEKCLDWFKHERPPIEHVTPQEGINLALTFLDSYDLLDLDTIEKWMKDNLQ